MKDIDDGGMGSIEFLHLGASERRIVRSCQFIDSDGVPVLVDLALFDDETPAELSFWKVNYKKVSSFPESESRLGPIRYENTN